MKNTIEILDAAKVASGCSSDYQFAKKYGLTVQKVSHWRNGRTFDESTAEMMAGILGREPGELMAISMADRSKDAKARGAWLRVAALLAAIGAGPSAHAGFDNNGQTGPIIRNSEYRLCARRGLLASIFGAPWPVQTI